MSNWQEMIVGDRMVVDDTFSEQIDRSPFSRQEWGLIMTASNFEIEAPDDADAARLVADTSDLPVIMPEVEKVASMGPMGRPQQEGSGSGIFGSFLDSLGLGGGNDGPSDEEKLQTAERLVDAYAAELQAHLEEEGRWDEIRATAAAANQD